MLAFVIRTFGALFVAAYRILTHTQSATIENKMDYIKGPS